MKRSLLAIGGSLVLLAAAPRAEACGHRLGGLGLGAYGGCGCGVPAVPAVPVTPVVAATGCGGCGLGYGGLGYGGLGYGGLGYGGLGSGLGKGW